MEVDPDSMPLPLLSISIISGFPKFSLDFMLANNRSVALALNTRRSSYVLSRSKVSPFCEYVLGVVATVT